MERVWWRGCGGEGVVERVWWRGCGGEGVVERVWWRGCGGEGVVERYGVERVGGEVWGGEDRWIEWGGAGGEERWKLVSVWSSYLLPHLPFSPHTHTGPPATVTAAMTWTTELV